MNPPVAPQKPHELSLHGHTRQDPFYWLNQRKHPEVIAYIEAENAYTAAGMQHTSGLQEKLYQEMLSRIQETDQDVPERRGPYEYFTRTEEGKQFAIHCRQPLGKPSEAEVLLDLNSISSESDYVRVGIFKPSPNHRILAYSIDLNGSEHYTVYFKNLDTGEMLPDTIENTGYSGEWGNDNRTFFYTIKDDAWRDFQLYRYTLGKPGAERLFEENDQLFSVHISKTRDSAFLVLSIDSIKTSERHVLAADDPAGSFQLLQPRTYGIEYGIDHRDGIFYIWTNENALNFKLMTAPAQSPEKESWAELLPHDPAVKIDYADCFADHLVIYKRENGLRTIEVRSFSEDKTHLVAFPEAAYTFRPSENPEFDTHMLRFTYLSPITPDSVIDYDMNSRAWDVRKRKPVLGGYNPDNYNVERAFAPAEDGTLVPMTLLYKKGMTMNGENPCLLYGYGSYGASNDPRFDMNIFSLVDRGFVFALAHIRGGGEMGRPWYENGKFLHKKNTFTDFIACGRHLVDSGVTQPEKTAIMGRSAGGLLIGAVVNMAPEMCRAAVAHVPFVDVITTMLDTSIPLTVGEFEEWGNPLDEAFYWYMLSYSPYDNVEVKTYPQLLATSGLNDPRVQYWEPTKWVARLRAVSGSPNRIFLKTNMGAGHGGAAGRYDYLKEQAFNYAFVLDSLGFTE